MRIGLFRRRIAHNNHLFTAQYIDPKALFAFYFNMLPNASYITEVEVNTAYAHLRKSVNGEVLDCLQHAQFNRDTCRMEFNVSFIVLAGARLIEVGGDYVTIYHGSRQSDWAAALLEDIARFRVKEAAKGPIGFATRQAVAG